MALVTDPFDCPFAMYFIDISSFHAGQGAWPAIV